jgi:hypothetical protein
MLPGWRRPWLALLLAAAGYSYSARARAGESVPEVERDPKAALDPNTKRAAEDDRPPLGIFETSEDALIDPRMRRSWGVAPPRLFVATTVDVGYVYARPRVSLGYGRPFTSWFGLDVNPIAASAGLGAYGGLRLELPRLDVRLGSRYFWAFHHTYLPAEFAYTRLDLETSSGTRASTLTHELEIDSAIPLGPGALLLRGSGSYVTGVPEGEDVFEETLHVIVRPPLVWRLRAGYAFWLGGRSQHSLAFVVDVLDIPKRDDSVTVRAGPLLRMVLSRRVEVRGSFVVTLSSPDRLGLVGGDFTELGVRYRWATE